MKKTSSLFASVSVSVSVVASCLLPFHARALDFNDIQIWAGDGTNRAALVIQWSAPEVRNNTSVPNPAAAQSLAWGFRWNGDATAETMLTAIAAADHRLFAVASSPSPFGTFVYGLGYDLNNNGVFGVRAGTNVFAENAFTNGLATFDSEDPDAAQALDAGDLFWSGSFGPYWETWQEQGLAGGFTSAPERGTNAYWTPDDPQAPYSGHHGQWELAQAGISDIALHDGSWLGWTVAAGGLDFPNPNAPGSIAYNFHKHAPAPPVPASMNTSFAVQVIASQGPFGGSPYNDPNCVTGAPATRFYESSTKPATRVKLLEPAYNVSVANGQTNKLIVTLNTGSSIIARFDHPVFDDPANPYGIDFLVFGNSFFSAGAFGDAANLNTTTLATGVFAEPTKISVSPGYTGLPGEVADDPSTWPWYRYEDGPYGDSSFPTHAYKWNRPAAQWTDELQDDTKPVNPALQERFAAGGLSAADGIDLYDGSGGGTGFDLAASGFASIQYIKAEGLSGFSGGEIDAFAIVRPMTIGDELSIAPANVVNDTARLFFQQPGDTSQNLVSLDFTAISDIARVKTSRIDEPDSFAPLPGVAINAFDVSIEPILGTGPIEFQADLSMSAGSSYAGNGQDLRVAQWTGTNWLAQPFAFDAIRHAVVLAGVTNLSAIAVNQIIPPQLAITAGSNGITLQFIPVPNCPHTLERSADFITWTALQSVTPTNAQPVTLQDNTVPSEKAFYRLRLNP